MFIGTTDVFVVIVDIDTEIFYTVAVVGVDLSMAAWCMEIVGIIIIDREIFAVKNNSHLSLEGSVARVYFFASLILHSCIIQGRR